jgi:ADP-ribose pyrophosphatase YjhB (NUDIX family)
VLCAFRVVAQPCFELSRVGGLDIYRERMSEVEDRIFAAVAARNLVRPSVRAIILRDGNILVQRPADSAPGGSYAFIGGEYEIGDTFESRLRRELEEETTARLMTWRYLFVVENLFVHAGHRIHALEHYVLATIETTDVQSREGHLVQEWLPLHSAADVDLRPFAVRDLLANDRYEQVRHVVVDGWRDRTDQ